MDHISGDLRAPFGMSEPEKFPQIKPKAHNTFNEKSTCKFFEVKKSNILSRSKTLREVWIIPLHTTGYTRPVKTIHRLHHRLKLWTDLLMWNIYKRRKSLLCNKVWYSYYITHISFISMPAKWKYLSPMVTFDVSCRQGSNKTLFGLIWRKFLMKDTFSCITFFTVRHLCTLAL